MNAPSDPAGDIYRLRTVGPSRHNALFLAPAGWALSTVLWDYWRGSVTTGTWIEFGIYLPLAILGLLYVYTPIELMADQTGIRWRQFGFRKAYAWSQIEEIGVGRNKMFDGPSGLVLLGRQYRDVGRRPTIGLKLRLGDRNAGTVAYLRGFTGYDTAFPSAFEVPIDKIVAELQARLVRAQTQ